MKKAAKVQEVRNELWTVSATVCVLRTGRHDEDRWVVTDEDREKLERIEALLTEARNLTEVL